MRDEKVIMDKDDYLEMINIIETLRRISKDDFVVDGGLVVLLKLLDKSQPRGE